MKAPCRVYVPWWWVNTGYEGITAEWNGCLNMREPHRNEHFSLSQENKYDVRLKLLRKQVYQSKLHCMITTRGCTQCWIPKSVILKAVIISKKKNNGRLLNFHVFLLFLRRSWWEYTFSRNQWRFSFMWLLCPSGTDVREFIFTFTFTSLCCPTVLEHL